MHVGIICCEYPPVHHGGTGSSYCDLAEGLVGIGHQVTVVGVYPSKLLKLDCVIEEKLNAVRVVRMPQSPSWLRYRLGALWDRRKLSARLTHEHTRVPFDVIEASDYAGWLRFGGPRGVPTVVRIRGSNYFFDTELKRAGGSFEHRLEREALARATHVASVSRYAASRTLEICGLSHRDCTVIPNAVDTTAFSPSEKVAVEPGLVVFVNSINPKKGITQLVQAMNIVCEGNPKAKLRVIGQDTQKKTSAGTYVEQLQSLLRPEYRDRVVFTGRMPRNEIIPWIQRAAVCCYPSHMETFGIAPVEAMSVGRPTIFSKLGPGPEVLEDGVSGLLCDPHSAKDIARCITTLFDDPALAQRLGDAARARVLELFDRRDWVRRNVAFFESCVSSLRRVAL